LAGCCQHCEPRRFRWLHAQGHWQLTDIYLLGLAIANRGRVATFDNTISVKAIEGASEQNLEIIAA
jgi:hypothetical protein